MPQRARKAIRHGKHTQRPGRSEGAGPAIGWWVVPLVLALIPFALGKYIEFKSPGPFDSGSYVYSAKDVLDGAKIGTETRPTARPGTLVANILGVWLCGYSETGPKLVQMLMQAGALVLMFIALRRVFGKLAASVGVVIASVYLSAPLLAKFGNVKEQYMIACMVMGVSCLIMRQAGGRWGWAVGAGAALVWGPLFKQTGVSAIAAAGLFVVLQPVLKHRGWKRTASDIGFLAAGAMAGLCPVYLWLVAAGAPPGYRPYTFITRPIVRMLNPPARRPPARQPEVTKEQEPDTAKAERPDAEEQGTRQEQPGFIMRLLPNYVRYSWEALGAKERAEVVRRILRYYGLLILPISLAAGALLARLIRLVVPSLRQRRKEYDRFVLLLGLWWVIDMALVWVSPRSYEQYYLPLNASAAMLGGYVVALYSDAFAASKLHKGKWAAVGAAGAVCIVIMSLHIFIGIKTSPHSGSVYRDPATGQAERRRGYAQRLEEVRSGGQGAWEVVAEYIRQNSSPDDKIYVWGWYPGIYVYAQRMSAAPKAVESELHTRTPERLSRMATDLLKSFQEDPPKFIVDTHKLHFPWDRPPLELWPIVHQGFLGTQKTHLLPLDEQQIARYDAAWSQMLAERFGRDEAARYEALKPLREFVMENYRVARVVGEQVVFELKDGAAGAGGGN